jgi:hypothetical protein
MACARALALSCWGGCKVNCLTRIWIEAWQPSLPVLRLSMPAAAATLVGAKLPAAEAAVQQPLLAATSSHLASMAAAGYRTLVVAGEHGASSRPFPGPGLAWLVLGCRLVPFAHKCEPLP